MQNVLRLFHYKKKCFSATGKTFSSGQYGRHLVTVYIQWVKVLATALTVDIYLVVAVALTVGKRSSGDRQMTKETFSEGPLAAGNTTAKNKFFYFFFCCHMATSKSSGFFEKKNTYMKYISFIFTCYLYIYEKKIVWHFDEIHLSYHTAKLDLWQGSVKNKLQF